MSSATSWARDVSSSSKQLEAGWQNRGLMDPQFSFGCTLIIHIYIYYVYNGSQCFMSKPAEIDDVNAAPTNL